MFSHPENAQIIKTKKKLASSLVLSKLDYGNSVYGGTIPQYLVLRLQKVQNAIAGFVYGKKASIKDVVNLSWLPVIERYQYAISVLAFKAMVDTKTPENMKVKLRNNNRNLRSNNDGVMFDCSDVMKTFQYESKRIFNDLPKSIRTADSINTFKSGCRKYLLDKALARSV